jgi:hypothetical protein
MSQPEASPPASAALCGAGPGPARDPRTGTEPAPQTADDSTIAAMYVRMWSLATGRRLQPCAKPEQLTPDELVDFWSDDLLSPVSGRHAAPEPDPAEEGR